MPKSKQQTPPAHPDINHKVKNNPPSPPVREVEFVLECIGADHVYVCGDFNDWQPTCLRMIGRRDAGLWEKRLVLPAGRHEYKFIVDGKWQHDPDARENVRNSYGSLNSVLEVQP
jgi:1,4-alpha-glucan branching enzyme